MSSSLSCQQQCDQGYCSVCKSSCYRVGCDNNHGCTPKQCIVSRRKRRAGNVVNISGSTSKKQKKDDEHIDDTDDDDDDEEDFSVLMSKERLMVKFARLLGMGDRTLQAFRTTRQMKHDELFVDYSKILVKRGAMKHFRDLLFSLASHLVGDEVGNQRQLLNAALAPPKWKIFTKNTIDTKMDEECMAALCRAAVIYRRLPKASTESRVALAVLDGVNSSSVLDAVDKQLENDGLSKRSNTRTALKHRYWRSNAFNDYNEMVSGCVLTKATHRSQRYNPNAVRIAVDHLLSSESIKPFNFRVRSIIVDGAKVVIPTLLREVSFDTLYASYYRSITGRMWKRTRFGERIDYSANNNGGAAASAAPDDDDDDDDNDNNDDDNGGANKGSTGNGVTRVSVGNSKPISHSVMRKITRVLTKDVVSVHVHGSDDFIVQIGFENFCRIHDIIEWMCDKSIVNAEKKEELLKKLSMVENFLKSDFPEHCSRSNDVNVAPHSAEHSLGEECFQVCANCVDVCEKCDMPFQLVVELSVLALNYRTRLQEGHALLPALDRLLNFHLNSVWDTLQEYMARIFRGKYQARKCVRYLSELDDETVHAVCDFKLKFVNSPTHNNEHTDGHATTTTTTTTSATTGILCHGMALLSKRGGTLSECVMTLRNILESNMLGVHYYVQLIEEHGVTQLDSALVVACLEALVLFVNSHRYVYPNVRKIRLQSENTNNYTNFLVMAMLPVINQYCKVRGVDIEIVGFVHTEAGVGKTMLDAMLKAMVRRVKTSRYTVGDQGIKEVDQLVTAIGSLRNVCVDVLEYSTASLVGGVPRCVSFKRVLEEHQSSSLFAAIPMCRDWCVDGTNVIGRRVSFCDQVAHVLELKSVGEWCNILQQVLNEKVLSGVERKSVVENFDGYEFKDGTQCMNMDVRPSNELTSDSLSALQKGTLCKKCNRYYMRSNHKCSVKQKKYDLVTYALMYAVETLGDSVALSTAASDGGVDFERNSGGSYSSQDHHLLNRSHFPKGWAHSLPHIQGSHVEPIVKDWIVNAHTNGYFASNGSNLDASSILSMLYQAKDEFDLPQFMPHQYISHALCAALVEMVHREMEDTHKWRMFANRGMLPPLFHSIEPLTKYDKQKLLHIMNELEMCFNPDCDVDELKVRLAEFIRKVTSPTHLQHVDTIDPKYLTTLELRNLLLHKGVNVSEYEATTQPLWQFYVEQMSIQRPSYASELDELYQQEPERLKVDELRKVLHDKFGISSTGRRYDQLVALLWAQRKQEAHSTNAAERSSLLNHHHHHHREGNTAAHVVVNLDNCGIVNDEDDHDDDDSLFRFDL